METESFVELDGVFVKFSATPCARCKWRYAYVCPMCKWNRFGVYDTYNTILVDKEKFKNERN